MVTMKLVIKITLIVAAVLLTFTPFYGFAYLIALWFGVQNIKFSKVFDTILSRIILTFLVFTATLMFAGLIAWFAHMPMYSILVLAVFAALILAFHRDFTVNAHSYRIINRGDIVCIILALIAPIIVVASFYLPKPTAAATYQFISTGWDNGSHLNMMQNNSNARGYVYAKYNSTKFHNSIERFDSYPQGWHLASANIVDGFSIKPLNAKHPIRALNTYAVIYLIWFAIAVYCFSRAAWYFAARSHKQQLRIVDCLLFALPNLLIQLVVLYGSLAHGFANYLGGIAYLSVLVAMIAEDDKDATTVRARYVVALLMGMAVTMTWLLPLPALALMILLGFVVPSIRASFTNSWSALRLKQNLGIYLITLLIAGAVITQLLIYQLFNAIKVDQLNAGSATGTFPVSSLFVGMVFVIATLFWIRDRRINNMFIAAALPMSILALSVYAYQILSIGSPSYYFGKVMGLLLITLGIFFVSAVANWLHTAMETYALNSLSVIMLVIGIVTILLIGSNQTTTSANYLLQRESKVTYPTAQAIVSYLKSANPQTTKLVVMRHEKRSEDDNGYLYSLIANIQYTCANYVTGSPYLNIQLRNLDKCAHSLASDKIIVITSDATNQKVKALRLANVQTVNIP